MALSLQTQWTLVASGLIAHADHVLAGEECERLMAMVDAEVDGDEYAQWMTTIGDADALAKLLTSLDAPPAAAHRPILENAWLMAVVDGERADEELEALESIAARLGVEPLQLEFWREAWTEAQHGFAETSTSALAWVLGGGGPGLPEDGGAIESFVQALPTTHEHREQLIARGSVPQDLDSAARPMRSLNKTQRRDAMARLVMAARDGSRPDDATERWRALGGAVGLAEDELEGIASE